MTDTTPSAPAQPASGFIRLMASAAGALILGFARFITAPRATFADAPPVDRPRVYFANHVSHGDFVLIWAVLPRRARARVRPVAGADYWMKSALRRFVGRDVFNAVLIERDSAARSADPVGQMAAALDEDASLIVFPEGTRNLTEAALLPFKSGLYHLARQRSDIDLVPVWIDNLNRVMPKGEFLPVPLICTLSFGEALRMNEGEAKQDFLDRAQAALLALAPKPKGR